jgi:hypothetical protein
MRHFIILLSFAVCAALLLQHDPFSSRELWHMHMLLPLLKDVSLIHPMHA